jgi:hypothetical protein
MWNGLGAEDADSEGKDELFFSAESRHGFETDSGKTSQRSWHLVLASKELRILLRDGRIEHSRPRSRKKMVAGRV